VTDSTSNVRVLVVEDEPLVAEAHAAYTSRVAGFEVVGVAHSATEAARMLGEREVDLVLLDMYLPDGHGLGLLRSLRAGGALVDVIAVTSARDAEMVRRAVAHGVVLYLIKPFTFPMFRAKLEQYADYRRQLGAAPDEVVQDEVDRMLGSLRVATSDGALPKGLTAERLHEAMDHLRTSPGVLSARELAERLDSSRVTARRYLEHLADVGLVARALRYGGSGRPEVEYRWQNADPGRTPPSGE
jgi:response regulator of citrate/malate metabolism